MEPQIPYNLENALNILYTFDNEEYISSVKDPERLRAWFANLKKRIHQTTGKPVNYHIGVRKLGLQPVI